jgi:arsenate reductase-like glutaredoxin family protein
MPVSFVDVARRAPAPGELRRFRERFGAGSLLDPESPAYRAAGLGYLRMDADEIMERLLADPRLLRLPLVRRGQRLSIGADVDAWEALLSPERPGP